MSARVFGGKTVRALVIGGRGAIGNGFVKALQAQKGLEKVVATSRQEGFAEAVAAGGDARVKGARLNPTNEEDFAKFTQDLKNDGFKPNLIFNATGLLHSSVKGGPTVRPEVSLKRITAEALTANFWANTLVNGLAMRFLLGELADKKEEAAVFATLSAKVGSISDNKLGGWISYRAAKAGVNMMVSCAAIECKRTHPGWRVIALHPGTVEGPLSAPFVGKAKAEKKVSNLAQYEELLSTAEPGADTPYVYWTPDVCAGRLLEVMDTRQPEDSGKLFDYAGKEILP